MKQEAQKVPNEPQRAPAGSRDSLPDWWTDAYQEAWEKRRDFLRGEWETLPGDQDKEDVLSRTESRSYRDWQSVEPAVRYGVGARQHYSQYDAWSAEVEDKLHADWKKHDSESTWERIKGAIRSGWESAVRGE